MRRALIAFITLLLTEMAGCAATTVEGTVLVQPTNGIIAGGTVTSHSSSVDRGEVLSTIVETMVNWCKEKNAVAVSDASSFELRCSKGGQCRQAPVPFTCMQLSSGSMIEDRVTTPGWKDRGIRPDIAESLADIVDHNDLSDTDFTANALGLTFAWADWIDTCEKCNFLTDHLVPLLSAPPLQRFDYANTARTNVTSSPDEITLSLTYAACFDPGRLIKNLDAVRLSYPPIVDGGGYPQGYLLPDRPGMLIRFVNEFSRCEVTITQLTKEPKVFSGALSGVKPTRQCRGSPADAYSGCNLPK